MWREVALACLIAAASAAALVAFGPPPEDSPVQLYRTLLVREGALVWDNLWYSGHYPVSYGILSPALASLVGQSTLLVGGAVLSAGIFAAICVGQFGDAARWPARAFGVLAAAPLFTGLDGYSLGLTCLLGALLALQRRRPWLAGGLGALTLAFSPLAFAFLCLVLVAVASGRRLPLLDRRVVLWTGGLIAVVAAVGLAVLVAFPNGGVYPFSAWDLALVTALCIAAGALAWRSPAGRPIAAVLGLWGFACLASFVVASPVGDNITRLRGLALPVTLIAAFLVRFRPLWLAVPAVALAAVNNIGPYLTMIPDQLDRRPAQASFWAPAIGYLAAHRAPGYRVEVVPTAAHWEAYWLPRAGVPLARGWFRQLDPPSLYDGRLDRDGYLTWLRQTGTRFVVLPHTRLDQTGGSVESRVLLQAAPALHPVFKSGTVTIFALRDPEAILTGATGDRISEFSHTAISGVAATAGIHRLSVRYMPYWRVSRGGICLRRDPQGLTIIEAARPGPFRLVVDQSPTALIAQIIGHDGNARCDDRPAPTG